MAAEFAGFAKEGQFDAVLEHFGEGLGGDLDIAVEQDAFDMPAFEFEQLLVVFLDDEAVAGFAQGGALLGDVEVGHGGVVALILLRQRSGRAPSRTAMRLRPVPVRCRP